jgi:hypothetical protein
MMVETVITTPLLSPSADGVPASSRLSRDARLGQRPYFRFRLVSRCLPPNLPLCLEQHDITPEIWGEFWIKIKALVVNVEQHEKLSKGLHILVFACVVGLIWALPLAASDDNEVVVTSIYTLNGTNINERLDLRTEDENAFDTTFLVSAVILVLVAMIAGRLCLSRKQSLHQAIELYCKDGEEASKFHANGYGLECELLPSEVNGSRLHLCILPIDRPYTRFEVYNGNLTFPGYNSSYLSSLALHSDMECESVPLEDWNNFSSEMTRLYEPQRQLASLAAKGFIVELSMLLLGPAVSNMINLSDLFADLLCVGLLGHMFVCSVYLVYRYHRFLGAKLTLVHELAMKLTPHGAYVEHRRVTHLYPWLGPYERHYVYLFPAVARGRTSAHDASADDAARSTESIRNRQALP